MKIPKDPSETLEEQATTRRRARREAAPALLVPTTSFDFLEGKFRATARLRLLNIIAAGLVAIFIVAAAVQAITTVISTRVSQSALSAAHSQLVAAEAAVAQDQIGGAAPKPEVAKHISDRAAQAATAAQNQLQVSRIMGEVSSLSAANRAAVETIAFSTGMGSGSLGSVRIEGFAPSIQAATILTDTLGDQLRFPYLTANDNAAAVQCRNPEDPRDLPRACKWSWSGQLNEKARATRSDGIMSRYDVKPLASPEAVG